MTVPHSAPFSVVFGRGRGEVSMAFVDVEDGVRTRAYSTMRVRIRLF
jgi:hypothetical protein